MQPAQWMRFFSARDSATLRRSALVFAILLPICFLFGIMLVAMGGQVLFPPEVTANGVMPHPEVGSKAGEVDQVVIVMIQKTVPEMLGVTFGAIVVTIILIAVLAASMSTADSNLHALGAVLTRDVYDRFVRPEASEREKTWFGRIVIVLGTLAGDQGENVRIVVVRVDGGELANLGTRRLQFVHSAIRQCYIFRRCY